jgi:PilZ domain
LVIHQGCGANRSCFWRKREKTTFFYQSKMLFEQEPVSKNDNEKRVSRRFALKLPASVRVSGIAGEIVTETENVSARGIFFYVDRWLEAGVRLEVTMSFPPQVTLTDPVRVKFLARVVRVLSDKPASRLGVAAVGVAAAIEEYEFIRSIDAAQDFPGMQPGWNFSASQDL